MRMAREIAHESAADKLNELCPPYGHVTACDEMTSAIRAAQIDALKWSLMMAACGERNAVKARIAELESDAVRPAGEVGGG